MLSFFKKRKDPSCYKAVVRFDRIIRDKRGHVVQQTENETECGIVVAHDLDDAWLKVRGHIVSKNSNTCTVCIRDITAKPATTEDTHRFFLDFFIP